MKLVISVVAFAGLFAMAACNDSALKEKEAAIQAQQHTIDSMNTELAKKKVVDSMNEVMSMQYAIPSTQALPAQDLKPAAATASSRHATKKSHASHAGSLANSSAAQAPVDQQEAPAVKHKKGWSAKAKGAVIGAGSGAVVGAIVNKRNRAAGAVIGGVLGAGSGTVIGAVIDKKKGR